MPAAQLFAGVPGVKYPAPKVKRPPLPAGCPQYVNSLAQLAPWVHAAGLWHRPPSLRTLFRWKSNQLIVTKRGATNVELINVPETLWKLTPRPERHA